MFTGMLGAAFVNQLLDVELQLVSKTRVFLPHPQSHRTLMQLGSAGNIEARLPFPARMCMAVSARGREAWDQPQITHISQNKKV